MQKVLHVARQVWQLARFRNSTHYWNERYRLGGDSGAGSYGEVARFKADFMNRFVAETGANTVLEFGCGDGAQLSLATYSNYLGLDISDTAVAMCTRKFSDEPSRSFMWYQWEHARTVSRYLSADLTLSQDVIYHLVEDEVFESYMCIMFAASRRYAVFFSSDKDEPSRHPHVRHRNFTKHARERHQEFDLVHVEPNPHPGLTFAKFYVFERVSDDRS